MLKKVLLGGVTALVLAACGGSENGADKKASASASEAAAKTASGNSLIERINSKGTIVVGTEGTYAPFTYHDKSGKLTGYDVEVTRAVASKLGVQVDFKETQWDAMLAGLKAGRFDMVANQVSLTTPERKATFDKSEVYNWSGPMLVVAADNNSINNIADVKGKKMAQSMSSNYGEVAVKNGAVLVPVDGMAQALTLIQQKRADATLNSSLSLLDYLKNNPNSGLKAVWEAPADEKEGAGLIFNKGQDEALVKVNTAMIELRNDGTLKKLGEQFFGKDVSVK